MTRDGRDGIEEDMRVDMDPKYGPEFAKSSPDGTGPVAWRKEEAAWGLAVALRSRNRDSR